MTDRKISVQSICEFLWGREKHHLLFSIKIHDVFIWQLIRFKTYHEIVQKTEVFNTPHPKNKSTVKIDVRDLIHRVKYFFISNPFWSFLKKAPIIIMPHARQVDGEDIYTDTIIKNTQNPLILYRDYKGERYKNSQTMDVAYLVFFVVYCLLKITRLKSFYYKENKILNDLQSDIKSEFDCDVSLNSVAYNSLLIFKIDYFLFKLLFKIKRTKTLYIVNAYSNFGVVKAAHDCGVRVIEMQHGIFTRYHLGYSYPNNDNISNYCPDELWCYGQFWIEDTPLPKSMRPVIYGFLYLTNLLQNFQKEKTSHQVLFASQGPISEGLYKLAQEFCRLRPDLNIIYRLHPSEILADYQSKLTDDLANFRLSSKDMHNEPSTYDLMAQSEFQVSVSSTTLLEGLYLGCKIAVVEMPSHEYMRGVIARGDAIFVRDANDLAHKIDDACVVSNVSYYYQEIGEMI